MANNMCKSSEKMNNNLSMDIFQYNKYTGALWLLLTSPPTVNDIVKCLSVPSEVTFFFSATSKFQEMIYVGEE